MVTLFRVRFMYPDARTITGLVLALAVMSSALPAAGSQDAQGAVEDPGREPRQALRYAFEPGSYRVVVKTTGTQYTGMKLPTTRITWDIDQKSVSQGGSVAFEAKLVNGKTRAAGLWDPDDRELVKNANAAMEKLGAKGFVIRGTVSALGVVTWTDGVWPQEFNDQAKFWIERSWREIADFTATPPGEPVGKRGVWKAVRRWSRTVPGQLLVTYRLRKRRKTQVTLSTAYETQLDPPFDVKNPEASETIEGKGTIDFDARRFVPRLVLKTDRSFWVKRTRAGQATTLRTEIQVRP